jgi:hypothetical protein
MSLAYTIFRSTGICEFSDVSTPCASECVQVAQSRQRSTYSKRCTCTVYQLRDIVSAIGDLRAARTFSRSPDSGTCRVCRRCAFLCAAEDARVA